jgi:hypothetical protein
MTSYIRKRRRCLLPSISSSSTTISPASQQPMPQSLHTILGGVLCMQHPRLASYDLGQSAYALDSQDRDILFSGATQKDDDTTLQSARCAKVTRTANNKNIRRVWSLDRL